MNQTRRNILSGTVSSAMLSVALAAGLLQPRSVAASALRTDLGNTLRQLATTRPIMSEAIHINAPAIAVDGASFFFEFSSVLPDVDTFVVFVEQNPQPMVAAFKLAPEVLPMIQMRIKVAKTSRVLVLARSGGKFYSNEKTVKVTVGGCGAGFN